ncbi:MAG: glutathione synthase [Pseudomonadota bacterium]|nr:glutathione synthase [Pseudomonadota bacterium]
MIMKFGVVMDPIESIAFKKDSSLAILLKAQERGHELVYMEPDSLFLTEKGPYAKVYDVLVKDDPNDWFSLENERITPLEELDLIIMRQDPPFDSSYIYNTYVLDQAETRGVKVVNKPSSLRDCNEKVFATEFPQCCTPFLVSSDEDLLREFINTHGDTVIKPLDGMGGSSIFRLKKGDSNIGVILETITNHFETKVMIQRYIKEIKDGDKRILLVDGNHFGAAISRVPAKGELRGNLAVGATAIASSLTEKDIWICEQVAPMLREKELTLVGLDVIGDYLTEINVTSPTCFREYKELCDIDVADKLLKVLESKASG